MGRLSCRMMRADGSGASAADPATGTQITTGALMQPEDIPASGCSYKLLVKTFLMRIPFVGAKLKCPTVAN
jgi:hypothetical protein